MPKILLFTACALSLALCARADISPEFQQILNEASADFKVNAADMKDCDADALEIARQALNRRFVTNAMAGPVVIGALENSCKAVLDAFGLGYIGSTYSVAKCAFQYLDGTNDTKGFAACLAAEGVSYVMGKAFEELDVNNVAAAGANVTAGKGLDALKDMINTYQSSGSRTEFDTVQYGPGQGFPCNVDVNVQWRKPRNPVRGDAEAFMIINISGCDCSRSNPYGGMTLESGSVRYRIPVKFYNDGGKPAWFVDNARATLEVRSKCCGRAQTTIRTYSHAGTLIRTGAEGGTTTGTTPPPVTPPPPPPPPPPIPPPRTQWPDGPAAQLALCPECAQIARDIELTRAGMADAAARIADIAKALAGNRAAQAPLARRIAQLQAEINSQVGTGGSAVDTTTGVTTSAVTQADGSVLVTTTAPDGTVLEQHSRPRRDTSRMRDEMDGVQKQLDQLKTDEASLSAQLARARAAAASLEADLPRLQADLAACLARCRERVTGLPAFSIETVHAVSGNNPFDPRNPLATGSSTPGTCPPPQPSPQVQTQSCPSGQTGSITTTRPYVCSGTAWVPGSATTVNTCTSSPTTCTTPQPPADTQTLQCPAGQTGSIMQTRTYTCSGTTWVPGPFTTTSNTCTAAATGCATAFSTGSYSCGGACGISSAGLNVTPGSSSMTANPFGSNSNVQFSCSGQSATSSSSNLTILGQPGHTCTLTGQTQTAFAISCRNNSGGTCASSCSR